MGVIFSLIGTSSGDSQPVSEERSTSLTFPPTTQGFAIGLKDSSSVIPGGIGASFIGAAILPTNDSYGKQYLTVRPSTSYDIRNFSHTLPGAPIAWGFSAYTSGPDGLIFAYNAAQYGFIGPLASVSFRDPSDSSEYGSFIGIRIIRGGDVIQNCYAQISVMNIKNLGSDYSNDFLHSILMENNPDFPATTFGTTFPANRFNPIASIDTSFVFDCGDYASWPNNFYLRMPFLNNRIRIRNMGFVYA